MKKENRAFTLVELIVVITILAILATIGFVSFSGYLAGTRDTNRIAQLKSMSDALELYRTKKDLPIPDDKIDIKSSGSVIAYQGYIGKNVLETIEYTESGLDPKDKNYFSYYLTKNKKYFQLLAFLEEENKDVVAMKPHPNPLLKGEGIIGKSFATDYSERYPKTTGKKLGILTDINNTPVQELSTITSSGYLDISTTTDEYVAHFSNTSKLSGTGAKLQYLKNTTIVGGLSVNCLTLYSKNSSGKLNDGIYLLDPVGNTPFPVYCDMKNGGWTLVASQGPVAGDTEIDDFGPISINSPGKMFSLDKINSIPHNDFGVTQKKTANPTNDFKYSYNIGFTSSENIIKTNTTYSLFSTCKVDKFLLSNGRLSFIMKKIIDGSPCYSWYKYKPSSTQNSSYVSSGEAAVNGDLIHGSDTRISDYKYYAFWIR